MSTCQLKLISGNRSIILIFNFFLFIIFFIKWIQCFYFGKKYKNLKMNRRFKIKQVRQLLISQN